MEKVGKEKLLLFHLNGDANEMDPENDSIERGQDDVPKDDDVEAAEVNAGADGTDASEVEVSGISEASTENTPLLKATPGE